MYLAYHIIEKIQKKSVVDPMKSLVMYNYSIGVLMMHVQMLDSGTLNSFPGGIARSTKIPSQTLGPQ